MRIIGSGFLARNLAGQPGVHPGVTIYAAGPSGGDVSDADAFARDAERLYATVAECRADGGRLVYLSTSSVGLYGRPGPLLRESGPVFPCSAYGRHKLAMEAVVRASGVDHLILRLAYPVGPHQPPHQVVPALVAQVRTGRVGIRRGARRDLVDVAHVAAIVDSLLTTGAASEVVNVASGTAVPVERIVAHIADRLGLRPVSTVVDVPEEAEIGIDRLRALVPEVVGYGFGPEYYRDVLDRYLPVAEAVGR
ncbi:MULTISPECIES: NAD-dependent epimerase/dehydratase family protein [unclassified Streptomyces]|jgi:nucleoside-diphosphate-sugar epimerase|uniref:NAD-dependent epimerase/dehydratase family protein n=1 Tax=unclassified Streptomyces TaxID=2593676 RepID=UPI0029A00D53|nr:MULTISPECIES: NAD-dependent epimerase/dehydratase family protein [unclassified Streptomyces]MDX2729903.1 NAD-dependent epimerase/dehydratase family protein [Streptomyces sp. PA03-2a]MDX3768553.1 NAD-dependent epimerase/dehydratase family protein [Streptomyces sp. AK08-01B]MDX3817884.1 NAD-dependent epimerase/dehydratase family protein [Streptomyces sp. AK08-01A]